MDDLFSLDGKTALVTGGSSGIGLMIAETLVRRGVATTIVARRTGEAAAALAQGGLATGLDGDLSTMEGVRQVAAAYLAREARLDILVNCAGVTANAPLDDFDEATWNSVVDINLKTPFFLTQALLPALRAAAAASDPAQGGHATVVNISSVGAMRAFGRENYPYGTSKAGLQHLSRMLARRLGPDGVTVNAIAPGYFPSKMSNPTPENVANARASNPVGRIGEADNIGGLVIYMASRAGAFLTGTVVTLDGGLTA